MNKTKKITLESLAGKMDAINSGLTKKIDEINSRLTKKIDENNALIRLTRQEMAKNEDLQAVKGTVGTIYQMLDSEAKFIEQAQTEAPITTKRLARLEEKLGLPHRVSE